MKDKQINNRKREICHPLTFIMSIPHNPNRKRFYSSLEQYGSFKGKGSSCWL